MTGRCVALDLGIAEIVRMISGSTIPDLLIEGKEIHEQGLYVKHPLLTNSWCPTWCLPLLVLWP